MSYLQLFRHIIIVPALLLTGALVVQAQRVTTDVPRTISYQGLLTSTDGTPFLDGEYRITVTLYADEQGTQPVWHDTYTTSLTGGLFNLNLGGEQPLPESSTLNTPLWIGTAVDGGTEMRPLTPLSASPYALNVPDKAISSAKVADGAITADKLGVNYVSEVRINGETVGSKGTVINLVGTPSVPLTYDAATQSVMVGRVAMRTADNEKGAGILANPEQVWSANGDGWDVLGGGPYTPVSGDWLGTSGAVDLEFRVENEQVMLYQTTGSGNIPNVIGGQGNTITGGTIGSIIAEGGGNSISGGNYNAIGGGTDNSISNGDNGAISGGRANVISASSRSNIDGGVENRISNSENSAIAGGMVNTITSTLGTSANFIGGGELDDITSSNWSGIGSGYENAVTVADHAFIGSGFYNTIDGADKSFIGSGLGNNINSADISVIGGGTSNEITGSSEVSVVGGGESNNIEDATRSVIGGGAENWVYDSFYSTIGGGSGNTAHQAPYSTLGGGSENWIDQGTEHGTIAGGYDNLVSDANFGTVGGGEQNGVVRAPYGTVPGGDQVVVYDSYAQTAVGFFNSPRGAVGVRPNAATIAASNDPLFMVGNGSIPGNSRSNAFEVSYNGHSVVYGELGNSPGPFAIEGATYADNIIYGWGEITGLGGINSGFGIGGVTHVPGTGVYTITLNLTDPLATPSAIPFTNLAVTATLNDNTCAFINVVRNAAPINTFTVNIRNASCMPIDLPFSFHVTGRR